MKKSTATLFLATLTLALSITTPAVARTAIQELEAGNYAEAYRQWARNEDSPESMWGFGRIYIEGLGGEKDVPKGLALMRKASAAGYTRAMIYLASYYEKQGSFSSALNELYRLQEKGKSRSRQEKIVDLLEKVTNKPLARNAKYCDQITILKTLGGAARSSDLTDCALNGLSSTLSKQEALNKKQSAVTKSATYDDLGKISKDSLDPKSPFFNPALVLTSLVQLDPALNSESTRMTVTRAGVRRSVCEDLAGNSAKDVEYKFAYCGLVAVAGDKELAAVVAEGYFRGDAGEDNKKYFKAFYQIAGEPENLASLALESLRTSNQWRDHQKLLSRTATNLPKDLLNLEAIFEADLVNSPTSGFKRNDLCKLVAIVAPLSKQLETTTIQKLIEADKNVAEGDTLSRITSSCKGFDQDLEVLNKAMNSPEALASTAQSAFTNKELLRYIATVSKLLGQTPPLDAAVASDFVLKASRLGNQQKNLYLDDQGLPQLANTFVSFVEKTSAKPQNTQALIKAVFRLGEDFSMLPGETMAFKTAQTGITRLKQRLVSTDTAGVLPKASNPNGVVTSEPRALSSDNDKLLSVGCYQASLPESCRSLGRLYLQRASVPFALEASDNKAQGIRHIEQAIKLGDIDANADIYDALHSDYPQSQDSDGQKRADRALEQLLVNNRPAGQLRSLERKINIDAIRNILSSVGGILGGGPSPKEVACSGLRELYEAGRLSQADQARARASLESTMKCARAPAPR